MTANEEQWETAVVTPGGESVVNDRLRTSVCSFLNLYNLVFMNYKEGQDIEIDFFYAIPPGDENQSSDGAWIGLWPADADPLSLPSPSANWKYICSNSQDDSSCEEANPTTGWVTLNGDSVDGMSWPLTSGTWMVHLIAGGMMDNTSYQSLASSEAFTIGVTEIPVDCNDAPQDSNPENLHLVPTDGANINKMAFGSCFKPTSQTAGPALWQHVRSNFGGEGSIWNWLGDNMYGDTSDSQAKRDAYNCARGDSYYSQYGPVAEPKIPTTGA